MTYQVQEEDGVFVAWGDSDKENSYVVKEKKAIEGLVTDVKKSETYGAIIYLKTKELDDELIIPLPTALRRQFGYMMDDNSEWLPEKESGKKPSQKVTRIVEGDKVKITYLGQVPTKHGKKAYTFTVEVDR